MKKHECKICHYLYIPEAGEEESDILPNTPFEKVRADFVCPVCKAPKEYFAPFNPECQFY